MTQETLTAIKKALQESNLYTLFQEDIGRTPHDLNDVECNEYYYALMYNLETDKLFFLDYATRDNHWAKVAESQNPWLLISYISAMDIIMNDPATTISDELDYQFEQQQEMEKCLNDYN